MHFRCGRIFYSRFARTIAKFVGERILKTVLHLEKLVAKIYWQLFSRNDVESVWLGFTEF